MRQKLPILAGITVFVLALAYTITTGTIQTVRAYGTGTQPITADVTALNTVRDNLTTAFTNQAHTRTTSQNSFAFTEENYLYGTSTCDTTNQGQYFFTTQLLSPTKLTKNAPYTIAKTIETHLAHGYTVTVKSSGGGDIPQIILRNSNKKVIGTILVVLSDLYTTRHNLTINGSLAVCHPLAELPKTNAQDLEDHS